MYKRQILGRKDNVINSGGIKIQAEEVEQLLRPFISVPFVITSVPDQRLGQAVTLLIEGRAETEEIENRLQTILTPYYLSLIHILVSRRYSRALERLCHAISKRIGRISRNG